MYQNYFGFKERPFQLVPNPAYLFPSRSHEEAMAHLTYATSEGDGFVAITGEVGTGKTTLCRAFIESLDERTEVAYVFNPKLTAVELLQSICDEFGIDASGCDTTKGLIDALNRFLLEKKGEGKQVMLIIDEAQNLNREVLEQIRLLSNLETSTEKLIQIVLSGQPEMGDALDAYELRQLSQRITLNCHLSPLTFEESTQYIRHRIRIAARNDGIDFSASALRKIYLFSEGIPRRIHIVCDRAFLVAYGTDRHKITGDIVDTAIRELDARGDANRLRFLEKRKTVLLVALLCLIVILLFTVKPGDFRKTPVGNVRDSVETPPEPETVLSTAPTMDTPIETSPRPIIVEVQESEPEPADLPKAAPPTPAPLPAASESTGPVEHPVVGKAPAPSLADLLVGIKDYGSKETALSGALSLWGTERPIRNYEAKELIDPETYFSLTARENGFQMHRMQSDLDRIAKLNLPAVFEFKLPGRVFGHFMTLIRIEDGMLRFLTDTEGGYLDATVEDVHSLWSGLVYLPWINFYGYEGTTPISGPEDGIITLKRLLQDMGYEDLTPGAVYDMKTESIVKEIQRSYGLPADGFVGPLTKIALYNEMPGLNIPHIQGNDR